MTEASKLPQSIRAKMVEAGISAPAIRSFEDSYLRMSGGGNGVIAESEIQMVHDLPRMEDLSCSGDPDGGLAGKLVVIKLNGGLGTGMGLDKAKSLLEVKNGLTFLDLIAQQVLSLRKKMHPGLRFLLMNSFSTREDTLKFLCQYAELSGGKNLDFLQSKVPKIDANTMEPVYWPANPDLEWCPPGHGDIYLSLFSSGLLDELIQEGIEYAFISNSDNLGAYPDLNILEYMNRGDLPFLMEVTRRTQADRKGGHLAVRSVDGRLILREAAQCSPEDKDSFQDIDRYRYFNTNNLWIRLDHLRAAMSGNGGFLSLPLITNRKTVDPTDGSSPAVLQLETAMGSAIEMFDGAGAIEVPRSRFAPVKKTDDLLGLRSDAYEITGDFQVRLVASRNGVPPAISLDSRHYKLIGDFDRRIHAIPSLEKCRKLEVKGCVEFAAGVRVEGDVCLINRKDSPVVIQGRSFCDQTCDLSDLDSLLE